MLNESHNNWIDDNRGGEREEVGAGTSLEIRPRGGHRLMTRRLALCLLLFLLRPMTLALIQTLTLEG